MGETLGRMLEEHIGRGQRLREAGTVHMLVYEMLHLNITS